MPSNYHLSFFSKEGVLKRSIDIALNQQPITFGSASTCHVRIASKSNSLPQELAQLYLKNNQITLNVVFAPIKVTFGSTKNSEELDSGEHLINTGDKIYLGNLFISLEEIDVNQKQNKEKAEKKTEKKNRRANRRKTSTRKVYK